MMLANYTPSCDLILGKVLVNNTSLALSGVLSPYGSIQGHMTLSVWAKVSLAVVGDASRSTWREDSIG